MEMKGRLGAIGALFFSIWLEYFSFWLVEEHYIDGNNSHNDD